MCEVLDSLRWWRLLACIVGAWMAWQAFALAGWLSPDSRDMSTLFVIGLVVGLLWESAAALGRWW